MSLRKIHKKDYKSRTNEQIEKTFVHGKLTNNKLKYKHRTYSLELEMEEIVPYRMKKKRV